MPVLRPSFDLDLHGHGQPDPTSSRHPPPARSTARARPQQDHPRHLANSHDFSLLCSYAMGNFYKDASIDDVCRQHTHVVSEDSRQVSLVR